MSTVFPLSMGLTGWANCGRFWSWTRTPKIAQSHDLWFVIDGKGTIELSDRRISIQRGDVILYPPGLLCSATQDVSNRLIISFTHFQLSGQDAVSDWIRQVSANLLVEPARDPLFLTKLLRRSWLCAQESTRQPEAEQWFRAALLELHEQFGPAATARSERHRVPLQRLCDAIREAPEKAWTSEVLARELNVSPSHFNKLFRQQTGRSPGRFVIEARIQQAETLLLFSNLIIGAIAEKLGYPDAFTFSKQFKKIRSLSPSAWRDGQDR